MRLFEEGKGPFWAAVLVTVGIWMFIWGLELEGVPLLDPDFIVEEMRLFSISDLRLPDQKKYFTIEPLS